MRINDDAHHAGTVHLGGAEAEIAQNERHIHAGWILSGRSCWYFNSTWPIRDDRPAKFTRCPRMLMCHTALPVTPPGAIIAQIERFAPASATASPGRPSVPPPRCPCTTPTTSAATSTPARRISPARVWPRMTLSPYGIGLPGMYICSAATPRGPGAHGMCGANAARGALRYLERAR
jgi:phytoene dehydrogenase-like protein